MSVAVVIAPATSGRAWEHRFCPRCGDACPRDARHKSLSVGSRGRFMCWRCGLDGWIDVPMTAVPFESSPSIINETRGRIAAARDLWTSSVSLLSGEAAAARSYLSRRGLDAQAIHAVDVSYVHRWPAPRIGPVLAFAFRDQRGDIVAIQGRAVMPNVSCPHPAIGAKKLGIFSTASVFGARAVAITEAPVDALSLRSAGLDAIATGGTTFPAWLPGALRMNGRVIVATDADDAGQCFARKLRDALRGAGILQSRIVRLRPDRSKDVNAELVADPTRFHADICRAIGDPE